MRVPNGRRHSLFFSKLFPFASSVAAQRLGIAVPIVRHGKSLSPYEGHNFAFSRRSHEGAQWHRNGIGYIGYREKEAANIVTSHEGASQHLMRRLALHLAATALLVAAAAAALLKETAAHCSGGLHLGLGLEGLLSQYGILCRG